MTNHHRLEEACSSLRRGIRGGVRKAAKLSVTGDDRHCSKNEPGKALFGSVPTLDFQIAAFNETQLAVNPGPMAVIKVRDGKPDAIKRSSTKKAVGEDILP